MSTTLRCPRGRPSGRIIVANERKIAQFLPSPPCPAHPEIISRNRKSAASASLFLASPLLLAVNVLNFGELGYVLQSGSVE